MSDQLTAAGEARQNVLRKMASGCPKTGHCTCVADVDALEAEAATRAVDEALSVVSDLRSVLVSEHGHDSDGPAPWPACLPVHIALNRAAALVAHLRGPRPEGEG